MCPGISPWLNRSLPRKVSHGREGISPFTLFSEHVESVRKSRELSNPVLRRNEIEGKACCRKQLVGNVAVSWRLEWGIYYNSLGYVHYHQQAFRKMCYTLLYTYPGTIMPEQDRGMMGIGYCL